MLAWWIVTYDNIYLPSLTAISTNTCQDARVSLSGPQFSTVLWLFAILAMLETNGKHTVYMWLFPQLPVCLLIPSL